MIKRSYIHSVPLCITILSILELISFLKVQGLIGAKSAFFSAAYAIAPVFGGLFGIGTLAGIIIGRRFLKFMFLGATSFGAGSSYIPTFAAAAYWRYEHALIRVGLPLFCIGAFSMHSVGSESYLYSLYWFIPVALYFVPIRTTFTTALGATFVQHAVGSVIWLYCVPTTYQLWMGLIPVVFFERLAYASIMTLAAYTLLAVKKYVRSEYLPVIKSEV